MRKEAKINNLKIEYFEKGQGEPLLFIHGGSISYRTYMPFINEASKTYRVFAPSLPGAGRSSTIPKGWQFSDYADLIKEFVEYNKIKPIIAGHSMGGAVAALSKKKYQNHFKDIYLLAPAGRKVQSSNSAVGNVAKSKLKALLQEHIDVKRDILINTLLHTVDYARIAQLFKELDLKNELQGYEDEITFVWGKHDKIFSRDYALDYMKLFNNSKAHWLESGHGLVNNNKEFLLDIFSK